MPSSHDLDSLCVAVRSAARLKYLFFWSHIPAHATQLGKECLSQWYATAFVIDGLQFPTAEHYMMFRKATLFGDSAKFSQSIPLRDFLLNTQERVLVEASPVDRIWGIGLAADDSEVANPPKWRGLNLLGFALMDVRERLR